MRASEGQRAGRAGWLLDATERAYGQVQARSFAVAITLSRFGWRESDLMGMVPRIGKRLFLGQAETTMTDLAVATLRRGFRAHLIRRGASGQLDFLHAQMRQAVLQRIGPDDATRRTLHAAINDHLETLDNNDPIVTAERMGQLIGEHDALRAARYYATLDASKADPTQRTGSTWALVEWLTTAPSADETTARTGWLCGWLEQPEISSQEQDRLADNFTFGLAGPMAPLLTTAILGALLTATLQTRQRLADTDPTNNTALRDLSVSHNKIGDILQAQGDLPGALKAYQAGMAIAERLARLDPGNSAWQRDLVVSHTNLYAVANALGHEALAHWHLVQCARTVSRMQHAGMFLDAALQQLQKQLDTAGIRADDPVGASDPSATETAAKEGAPRQPRRTAPQTTATAEPEDAGSPAAQAARASTAYQRALADWKALPIWKRLTTKKPEPPAGI